MKWGEAVHEEGGAWLVCGWLSDLTVVDEKRPVCLLCVGEGGRGEGGGSTQVTIVVIIIIGRMIRKTSYSDI